MLATVGMANVDNVFDSRPYIYKFPMLDPTTREDVHLKILVPSCAAGAVIGKGGETIGKLQRESSAKMKMSKNQDTFPGERAYFLLTLIN